MRLPNPERAIVDVSKLREYCLNRSHPRGRHKARVFASALGLAAADADTLRRALLDAVLHSQAIPGERDQHGQRFMLDFQMTTPRGTAGVRSVWIVRAGEDFPRLLTCFVL
jgi:Domain of unknown function (DUF6883)